MDQFKAIQSGPLTLMLIDDGNFEAVQGQFRQFPDCDYYVVEIAKSYRPQYDQAKRRTKYGFYTLFNNEIAGLSLLGISSWDCRRGYTGADTLPHMKGRGIAPAASLCYSIWPLKFLI